jgi:large subunit ribosomal protein L15
MELHDLKPAKGAFKQRKRVGRGHGSGSVKTAGRGTKGQNSRAGGGVRIGFEGGQNPIYRRMPYKRGFTNIFRVEYETVNVGELARLGIEGDITLEALIARGTVTKPRRPLKILGDGELHAPLTVRAHKFTATAKAKIEAAGGRAEVVES